jgi:hypothetical protein
VGFSIDIIITLPLVGHFGSSTTQGRTILVSHISRALLGSRGHVRYIHTDGGHAIAAATLIIAKECGTQVTGHDHGPDRGNACDTPDGGRHFHCTSRHCAVHGTNGCLAQVLHCTIAHLCDTGGGVDDDYSLTVSNIILFDGSCMYVWRMVSLS